MGHDSAGRTLKTARAVLQALKIVALAPVGVRPDDIAAELHKSTATATYLLNSLCREGFAYRDPVDRRYHLAGTGGPGPAGVAPHELRAAAEELYRRTNQRTYLATPEDRHVEVHDAFGRQGLPRVPGLAPRIAGEAHALAVGKAVLANAGADAVATHADTHGLTAFTPATITAPDVLARELARVRARGVAVDREEFAAGFCCVAAPIFDADGRLRGALALSTTRARFDADQQRLITAVSDVARAVGVCDRAPADHPGGAPAAAPRHLRAVPRPLSG